MQESFGQELPAELSAPARILTAVLGGGRMQTQALWELFQDTGAPEAYLLYKRALQNGAAGTEAKNTACI